MNKAWRCEARDHANHRCTHRAGHDDPDRVDHPTPHLAFGRTWKTPAPEVEPPAVPAEVEGVS